MKVRDNMAFALTSPRHQGRDRRRVATPPDLGLEPYLDRFPAVVGGQRQRVAMGRAIVRKPQVFLF